MRFFVVCAAVVMSALGTAVVSPAQQVAGDTVAVVNGQPVYMWEVRLLAPQVQAEMARQGMRPEREAIIQAATQRLVDMRLLGQEAQRLELEAAPERVDQTMDEIVQQAGGREALDTTLAGMGVTYDQLRASVAESDLVQVFIATQVEPQVTVSAEEVDAFYADNPAIFAQPEQVHARHILMKATPEDPQEVRDAARARAAAARERAVAGEDFAALATELSEGPSAPQGGDLGFFAREQMVGPFADAAFALDIGAISEVVETRFGYHVIKVEEKRPPSTMSLEEAREPLERMLHDQEAGEKLATILENLAADATVTEPGAPESAPDAAGPDPVGGEGEDDDS